MAKILAVFGATGQQGGSVVNNVLNDPELSAQYKIRAITRDVHSDKAKQLEEKGVEVVQCDILDRSSLERALTGAHAVFAVTVPSFGPDPVETECSSAQRIADVAVEKGVEFFIFSTLPSVAEISDGRYTHVFPFEAKAKAEKYIRGLPIRSAFCSFGFFMENLQSQAFLAPQPKADGTWALSRPTGGKFGLPYLDAVGDAGKFVGALLAKPDQYEGVTLCAAQGLYTWEDIAAAIAKNTGKTVVFERVSVEDFKKTLPFAPDLWVDGMLASEEHGYFGPGTEKSVAWAVEQTRGKLTSLDEFLEAHPFQLA